MRGSLVATVVILLATLFVMACILSTSNSLIRSSFADETVAAQSSSRYSSSDFIPNGEPICSTATKAGTWHYAKRGGSKVKISYRYKDGSYPTRITKIGKRVYYFKDSMGSLGRSKNARRVIAIGNQRFDVKQDGTLCSGWQVVNDRLYCFSGAYHEACANVTIDGVTLQENGSAEDNLNASVKKKAIRTLNRITDRSASKSAQLAAAWRYMTSRSFTYVIYPVNVNNASWAKRYANEMLSTHRGDCYGFAACFAALAHEIGYKNIKMITCRVPGSRDHAADHFTRHCFVTIGGRYFDPEAHFAGFARNVYFSRSYPMPIKARKDKSWNKYVGTGPARGLSVGYNKRYIMHVSKKGNRYYGYRGTTKLSGLYCINGKLYRFNKHGVMKASTFRTYQKARQSGRPWERLRQLIGKPSSSSAAASCYQEGNGVDVTYRYKHANIYTFRPNNGGAEIVLGVDVR